MTITQSVKTGSQLLLEAWANSDTSAVLQFDSQCPLFDLNPAALIADQRALVVEREKFENGQVFYLFTEYCFNHHTPHRWAAEAHRACDSETEANNVIEQWLHSRLRKL